MLTTTNTLTVAEVKQLAADWYQKLDVHAPLIELLPLLAEDDLEMVFPEATLHGQAEFEGWYEGVIRIFFDEVHSLKTVDVTLTDDGADVGVVVHWEASVWKAPARNSQRIKLDAYQTWQVKRSPISGKPVIVRYTVDRLEYAADSAKL
ncbi:MAG TPA: hypothetical protein VL132_11825 [Planctomycetaceae bacterium]|jgi:hypothetical protein|nr:hypothetical protein [Planctomycetaceae bacterium]